MDENYESGVVNIKGGTDSPATNLLDKGRYVVNPIEISEFVSSSNNQCIKITLDVEGTRIDDVIVTKLSWNMIRLRNFLYSIGMRQSSGFKVNVEEISKNMKPVKADIIIGKDQNGEARNEVKHYTSIDDEEAPIKGVPTEEESVEEKPKEESKPQEEEDDL